MLPLLPFDPFVSATSYPKGSPDPLPEVQLEETCTLPPVPPFPGYAIAEPVAPDPCSYSPGVVTPLIVILPPPFTPEPPVACVPAPTIEPPAVLVGSSNLEDEGTVV